LTDNSFETLIENHVIVVYDGICGFCNVSIQFILQQKPSNRLRFMSFQSDLGQELVSRLNINENLDSIIVVEHSQVYEKSTAIFKVLNHVNSRWKYLRIFRLVPSFISDLAYDVIAKNRYRIWQNNSCKMLTSKEAELFLK